MSAVISKTKTLSDLLKPTGFECPEDLRGKTFDDATSGGGTGGTPDYSKIEVLPFGTSSGEVVTSEAITPSLYKTFRILTDAKNQELTRYVDGEIDTSHSTLQPGKSVTVTNEEYAGGIVSLEYSVAPDRINKGDIGSGTIYNMGDFYLFIGSTFKISTDLDTWTDITSKVSAEVQRLWNSGEIVTGTGYFYIWASSPAYGEVGPTIYKVSITKEGDVKETNFSIDTEGFSTSAAADTIQNGYLCIVYNSSEHPLLISILDNDSSVQKKDYLENVDILSSITGIKILYVNNSWLVYDRWAYTSNVYKYTGASGSLVSAGTLTSPAADSQVRNLYYFNNKLFYTDNRLQTGFYCSNDAGTTWTTVTVEDGYGGDDALYYLPDPGIYIVYNSSYGSKFSPDLTSWDEAYLDTYQGELSPTLEGDGLVGVVNYSEDDGLVGVVNYSEGDGLVGVVNYSGTHISLTTFEAGVFAKVVTSTAASEMPSLIFLGEKKE